MKQLWAVISCGLISFALLAFASFIVWLAWDTMASIYRIAT